MSEAKEDKAAKAITVADATQKRDRASGGPHATASALRWEGASP